MIRVDATVDELTADPHPILAAARERGPVVWLSALDAWLVTDRATAVSVMRDPERFTVDDPRFSTSQVIGPSRLSTDGDEHQRPGHGGASPVSGSGRWSRGTSSRRALRLNCRLRM